MAAKSRAERKASVGPIGRRLAWAAAIPVSCAASFPANAAFPDASLDMIFANAGDALWLAVCTGSVLAAGVTSTLFLRARKDHRVEAAEAEIGRLKALLDRSEALLSADDQKTLVWDGVSGTPQLFGGLPERVGAPTERNAFLSVATWIVGEGGQQLEEAVQRLRRFGEGFQLSVRSQAGAVLEITGRTSGKRSLVRFRELTGERRSFAELKEQAGYVVNEMTAFRTLADTLPFPLWRRNRVGRLTWVNAAYLAAVEAASQEAVLASGVELLPARARDAIREAHRGGTPYFESSAAIMAGQRRRLQIFDIAIEGGSIGCAIDVSEVDAVRDELRVANESHSRAMDQLTAAVAVFDSGRKLVFANAAFRTLWELPPAVLENRPEEGIILDQLRAERKLPEQANYREWKQRHLAAYQSDETREDWWHLPDGRSLRMVATPNSAGGLTYIYENVTEQLALESQLASVSQLQGETLDHLSEAVAVFASDGRLRLFNPVFANIWRLSPVRLREEPHINEIVSNCLAIFPDEASWQAVKQAITNFEHADQASGQMHRPDGSVIDYASVALPQGMTMLTFVDVTDSARVNRMLSERNDALEAADRLKSEFIQHVSYELRSPLTSIIGFAEMIAAETVGTLNPMQREYMDHISSSSSALLAIINDILDLATVDAGIMALDYSEVDIGAVARAAVEGLRDRLTEQKIDLKLDIAGDLGTFHVDPARVRQILFNLVANAIRFSHAGSDIRVEAERKGGWVSYTVRDNGVGIPADVLPTVFEPFEGHAGAGRRRGVGLGLSIVKSLVELHGGRIDLSSEEGVGTVATVHLPELPVQASIAAE